jgi:hypothetical protein
MKNTNIFAKSAGIPRYKVGFYAFIAAALGTAVALTLVL